MRNELKDTKVTVTCLMPGATDTNVFARADMLDTKVNRQEKADPATVAKDGFDAMMRGDSSIISGWTNKVLATLSCVVPTTILAESLAKPDGE